MNTFLKGMFIILVFSANAGVFWYYTDYLSAHPTGISKSELYAKLVDAANHEAQSALNRGDENIAGAWTLLEKNYRKKHQIWKNSSVDVDALIDAGQWFQVVTKEMDSTPPTMDMEFTTEEAMSILAYYESSDKGLRRPFTPANFMLTHHLLEQLFKLSDGEIEDIEVQFPDVFRKTVEHYAQRPRKKNKMNNVYGPNP